MGVVLVLMLVLCRFWCGCCVGFSVRIVSVLVLVFRWLCGCCVGLSVGVVSAFVLVLYRF